jgi:TetR/AcrR family transcriptional repressor of bet genes
MSVEPQMGRPKNTEQRRAEIVEGMLEVMAERGYDGASVQAIAKAAGLTGGLVHYHFGNKREILVALVEALAARLRARYDARVGEGDGEGDGEGESGADPWCALDAFIDAHLALGPDADPRAVACWVAIGAEALRDEQVRRVYQRAVERQRSTLEALVTRCCPELDRDERRRRAAVLLAAMQGAYQLAAVTDVIPAGSAAPTVKAAARGVLGAPAEPRR